MLIFKEKDLLAQLDKFTVTKEKEVYNFDADKKLSKINNLEFN